MRRFWIVLVAMAIVALPFVGCGSPDDGATATTAAIETSTSTALAAATSTTAAPAPDTSTTAAAPAETTTTAAPPADTSTSMAAPAADWTTVAKLSSTDPFREGMDGIFISEPFTLAGEAQLVLDMPGAGKLDGVIIAIVPADQATDVFALLAAVQNGVVVTVPAAYPTQAVPAPAGSYVLVNSVPPATAWSVELQTRP